jgi:hypothetical protein
LLGFPVSGDSHSLFFSEVFLLLITPTGLLTIKVWIDTIEGFLLTLHTSLSLLHCGEDKWLLDDIYELKFFLVLVNLGTEENETITHTVFTIITTIIWLVKWLILTPTGLSFTWKWILTEGNTVTHGWSSWVNTSLLEHGEESEILPLRNWLSIIKSV